MYEHVRGHLWLPFDFGQTVKNHLEKMFAIFQLFTPDFAFSENPYFRSAHVTFQFFGIL
jgi:hypothetical protein